MGFLDNFKKKLSSPKKGATQIPETTEESKNKRNLKFILLGVGAFIFLIFVFSMFSPDTTTQAGKQQTTPIRREGIQSQFEETELDYEEWIMDAAGKIKNVTDQAEKNAKAIKDVKEGQENFQKEIAQMRKTMEENFKLIQGELSRPISPTPTQSTSEYQLRGTQSAQESTGDGMKEEKKIIIFEKGSSRNESDSSTEFTAFDYTEIISPSGSVARATLLTGVYATEGNAYPVLLEVTSPLYETKREINNIVLYSFIVGEALGDISSSRVYIRLQSIALYLKDKTVKTLPVKGWATDARDGSYGVQGDVMQRDGSFLGLSLLASFIGGVGDAVAAAGRLTTTVPTSGGMYQVSQIDSTKIWEVAAASGISQAAGQLSERYMQKAEEIRPVVCVSPGIIVDVILINDLKNVPIQAQQTGGKQ